MSVFTWLMYGIADRINTMTETIVRLGDDVHTMTEVQMIMAQDIGAMSNGVTGLQVSVQNIDGQVQMMSRNMAVMTGNTARMSYDVGRSANMFSSPMAYFWNMNP
ncbi:hypothetical protein ACFL12_03645 [Pseudomonadota bacterium]